MDKIQIYRERPELNQSLLKALLKGVDAYKAQLQEENTDLYYEEKSFRIYGSAVDTLITEGKEVFEEKYFVANLLKPSPTVMSIIKNVFDDLVLKDGIEQIANTQLSDYPDEIWDSCNKHSYFMNRAKKTVEGDSRIDTVIKENGSYYFKELINSYGKTMITEAENSIIFSIYKSITEHHATRGLFILGDDEEIFFQNPLYFEYEGVACKMLPDWYKINHTQKTIQPYDLKTTRQRTIDFIWDVSTFRYDIQAIWYTIGLQQNYPDYEVLPFKFVVETTQEGKQGTPLVYTCSENFLSVALNGKEEVVVDGTVLKKPVMGLVQLMDLYKWHCENGFEQDRNVLLADYQFIMDHNKILNF